MKPIFGPGDFKPDKSIANWWDRHSELAAEMANAKLASLGIDAETPEKLKRLERNIEAIAKRLEFYKDQTDLREKSLSGLERMIAEAPVVFSSYEWEPPLHTWMKFGIEGKTTLRARLVMIEEIK